MNLLVWTIAVFAPATARTQIFVAGTSNNGRIDIYGLDGSTIASPLVSGMGSAIGIAVSGQDIFVSTTGTNISEYTTSGTTVSSPLLTVGPTSGLVNPGGLAVAGSDLFVADQGAGMIAEYTTSGAKVSVPLVGVPGIQGIAASGSNLFVTTFTGVGEYTTSGAVVNASLISGLSVPEGIAVWGSDLFVVNGGGVTEYTLGATPGTIASSAGLISGSGQWFGVAAYGSDLYLASPYGDAMFDMSGNRIRNFGAGAGGSAFIAAVPEPATGAIAVVAGLALLARRPRRGRAGE